MLRQFHFIDQNGKDQGINVRNRASELVKLLGDVELIRSERKKARTNRNKFGGFEGGSMGGGMSIGGGMGGGMSNSRYGGFGSETLSFGGYSGGVYGDGGGFGGNSSDFQDTAPARRGNRFEEYDEYDEADAAPARRRAASPPRARQTKQPEPPKPKAPEPDLFDFGEEETVTTSVNAGKKPAGSNGLDVLDANPIDDDEFDDFQSATPTPGPAQATSNQFGIPPPANTVSTTSSTQFAAPKPVSATQGTNLNGLVGFTSMTPTPTSSTMASPTLSQSSMVQPQQQKSVQSKPTGFQAATPNYFTSVSTMQPQAGISNHRPGMPPTSSFTSASSGSPAAAKPAASKSSGGDAFGSLWSSASASAGLQKSNANASKGPNLASMAKEKASAGIWGAPATPSLAYSSPSLSQSRTTPQQGAKTGSSGLDDLLG
jgi:epsin